MRNGVLLRQVINTIDELNFDKYSERHAFGEIYEEILRSLQSAGSSGEFYTPRAVTDFMAKMIKPKLGESIADFACGTGGFLVSALKELDAQLQTPADREAYSRSVYGMDSKPLPYLLCVTNMLLHDIDSPAIIHSNSLERNVREYREPDRFDVILMNPPYGGSELDIVKNNFPAEFRSSETADLFMTLIMYRLKQNGRAAVIVPDGFLFGGSTKAVIKKKLINDFNLHTVIRMPQSVFAPYTDIATNILFFDHTRKTKETWFYRVDMPDGFKHFSKTKPMRLEHFTTTMEWWNDRNPISIDGFDKARSYTAQELAEREYNLDVCGYPHEEEEILPPHELIELFQEKRAALNETINRMFDNIDTVLAGNPPITKQHLADSMLELASLSGTFPARLKKAVLQYAVQGKLVEQNPLDQVVDIPAFNGEEPFDIPETWRWVRLNDLCSYIQRGKSPKYSRINKIPVIAQKCNQWSGFSIEKAQFIDPETLPSYKKERLLQNDDLMWNSTGLGTLGRMAIYKTALNPYGIAVADSHVTVIRANPELALPQYLYYYFSNPTVQEVIEDQSDGSTKQKELSTTTVRNYPTPLPPLDEQQRIVAQVEKLLATIEG